MLSIIYLVPVLICSVVGVGLLTGFGALLARRKSKGKGDDSKSMEKSKSSKKRSRVNGLEKSRNKEQVKTNEVEKPLTRKKAEKSDKKTKDEISVSNKKGKGVLALKNPNTKALFNSGDAVMRAEFRNCIDKYNDAYNGEQDNQASLKVTYSDGTKKDDFFAGPETVIVDDMFPFVFENTKEESRYPTSVIMNMGGRPYSFKFESKEEAQSFYEERFGQKRVTMNTEETKTDTRSI